jgi:benzoate-CoA ligase family protein
MMPRMRSHPTTLAAHAAAGPDLPERLNIAERFLDARVSEGRGNRVALRTDAANLSYREVKSLAERWARLLSEAGVACEQRVLIALPDGPDFVGVLFGTLKLGAVVVMVNPGMPAADVRYFLEYTRARAVVAAAACAPAFAEAARGLPGALALLVADDPALANRLARAPDGLPTFDTHRDDAALWLFSGGTTGRPKAVVQTHASFANTTALYGHGVIGYREDDITLSVPKLYFGYATGSNLFFPFSVGASVALFPEPATAESVFARIRQHRPTVLVNVPAMIHKMTSCPGVTRADVASLRVVTSAGEALPAELDAAWRERFGVELLDGLGTAEMWHIFISNRPGGARAGTLGQVVPGFEVRVCDEDGRELPRGETGWLWVRGGSRALGYWQQHERTQQAFRGEWYVSGDLITMDHEGYVTYCGRGDELLKVSGKWLAPAEVEGCLLQHAAVVEAAVVGRADANGLTKPVAFVVARERRAGLDAELQAFVRERLDAYKAPREVTFVDALPRTHLGKVDRGRLRRDATPPSAEER